MLLRQLPPDAALRRSIDPEQAAWGMPEQLLAAVVDEVRLWRWQYAASHTKKGAKKPPQPKRIPRPGVKDRDTRFGSARKTPQEMRALLDRWAGR